MKIIIIMIIMNMNNDENKWNEIINEVLMIIM